MHTQIINGTTYFGHENNGSIVSNNKKRRIPA